MLPGLFGVAEGITDAQIDTIDRNLDGLVLQEVFSAAVGFHFDASFVGKASHAAYADGQFVVQERFGEIGGQDVEDDADELFFRCSCHSDFVFLLYCKLRANCAYMQLRANVFSPCSFSACSALWLSSAVREPIW